ncbi:hypothetical protein Taro_035139 [Colocasia esculenta]|uniref:Uncharacterized protein n=1 Tax=Colocasia esculenta TaxID=4460 RepID=A0A843VY82_COLES|nr:hypothetical protein [Colocasia esculenta]
MQDEVRATRCDLKHYKDISSISPRANCTLEGLPKGASYHFATKREVADARIAWDKIAANRFTDYLNKHKAAAKKKAKAVMAPPCPDHTIEAREAERVKRDNDEDEDPRIHDY